MEQQTALKREFIIDRNGKSFVLYAGLLDLAHTQGLRAIRTRIVQIPSEDNNQTAIVHAEVETDKGFFSGIGDANPGNVSRAMLTATIRLAETRAKARALRDAVNVGVAALEEMAEEEPEQHPAPRPAPRPQPPTGIAPPPREPTPIQNGQRPQPNAANLATPAQVRAIYSIARDHHNMNENDIEERSRTLFGAPPAELTRQQASELISAIKPRGEVR